MTRWQHADVPRGDDYDLRWQTLAADGQYVHGEADLVCALLEETGETGETGVRSVLDAGCGTGRVAIELSRRGLAVSGIDADPAMLATAREKAPALDWRLGDLAAPAAVPEGPFDLVLLAGNVMIFLEPGTEGRVLGDLAGRLHPGGLLVAGFSLGPDRLSLYKYDRLAAAAGLRRVGRWATWDRETFTGGDYAVSAHRPRGSITRHPNR